MSRWSGVIGFSETKEKSPGVWDYDGIVEKRFKGDILDDYRKYESPINDSTNDEVNISNRISIIAKPYISNHISEIKYIEFGGALWKVKTVQFHRHRLILTVGGVWNA